MHLVRRDPHTCGVDRSRWRREDLLAQCPWLGLRTPQGLGHLLGRLGISYQRGRHYLHSPDPDYDAKLAAVATAWQAAREAPETQVLLYLDEVTVCRQPTLAPAWATRDGDQPRAQRSYRADTETRILGALNAVTGVLHSVRAAKIRLPILRTFFQTLVAAYPERTLTVVLDNWPVHFHPDLLVALVPQRHPFPYYLSASWPRATADRRGPRGPPGLADPTPAAAHLRFLGQPDRESLAETAPGAGPSPSLGRRPAPLAGRTRSLAGRVPGAIPRPAALRRPGYP